jgi:hypothetical protein
MWLFKVLSLFTHYTHKVCFTHNGLAIYEI